MAKDRTEDGGRELGEVVSVVGPGMKIVGDCSSDGTIRVEGRIEGSVRAGKSVVVGAEGVVLGNVATQDAIIAGHVNGSITAESRVELQSSCRVEGDIRSRRVKLDEGGHVDGKLHMGAARGQEGAAKAETATGASGGRAGADRAAGDAGSDRPGDGRPAAGSTSTGGSGSARSAAETSAAARAASGDKAGDKGSDKGSAGGGEQGAASGSARHAAALKETRSR